MTSKRIWEKSLGFRAWMGEKRKVRFHPAGEERIKKQLLEGAAHVEVPDHVTDTVGLWAWVKEVKPNIHSFLAFDGWKQVMEDLVKRDLPNEFDFHFREAPKTTRPGQGLDWMGDLISRIDSWCSVSLKPENHIQALPWPFVPVQMDDASSGASSSGLSLRVLDLGANQTIQAIWGKQSAVKIIERESYRELWKLKVEPLFNQDCRAAVLLLGNPGVGKTAFLCYLLVILLESKKKVLLRTKGASLYFFEPDAAGTYQTSLVGSYADAMLSCDPDVYFLADGGLPVVPEFVGKAFLACNPLRENYKNYEKDGACRTFYLPTWTSNELALLRQEVFPGEDLQATRNRYLEWGGNPRHVLELTSKDLQSIIQNMPAVENVAAAVASGAYHPLHNILYMRVLADFDDYEMEYASPFVRKAVYQKFYQDQVNTRAFRAFVAFKGTVMQGFGSLKGGLLQEYFRRVALNTKQFRVREVFENLATTLPAPKMESFVFGEPVNIWRLDDLVSKVSDRIIWPENPIKETIDAVRITENASGEDVLQGFQITLNSERHRQGLKYTGILELMAKFCIPAHRVEVYIVTTNELFGDAGWQNWRMSNNTVIRDMSITTILQGIRQFALNSNA